MHIFVDISANHQLSIGCCVILPNLNIGFTDKKLLIQYIRPLIQYVQLKSTTSTDAELELIDSVISTLEPKTSPIYIYTDCNNFYNLSIKRAYSPGHSKALLYSKLLGDIIRLNLIVIHATGHSKKELQVTIEQQIFSIVDKSARKVLRERVKTLN